MKKNSNNNNNITTYNIEDYNFICKDYYNRNIILNDMFYDNKKVLDFKLIIPEKKKNKKKLSGFLGGNIK